MPDNNVKFIPFGEMPGFPNLFLDYISEFENTSRFYKYDFRNAESYQTVIDSVLKRPTSNQADVAGIIEQQYKHLLPAEKTQANIAALKRKNTVAVVTGQQAGIIGGPLYTVYKTFTAIKLAEHLKTLYPKINFVPVFWIEIEDHDFEEIRHASILDAVSSLKQISYNVEDGFLDEHFSVGTIELTAEIDSFFIALEESLRNTEFTSNMLNELKRIYRPGRTFKDAFKDLLFSMFDSYGLVLFDPSDKGVKKFLSDVFINEIENFRWHSAALIERSAELEELYHAQVKVRPVNLFYQMEGRRFNIDPDEDGYFRLRGKKVKFSKEELLNAASETPELFSPNVLLRPICQDTLFNTAFYIAGPSEIAYFAQVMPLYSMFDIPEPVIYPRASVTLLEKHLNDILIKYNLSIQNLFLNRDNLRDLLLENTLPVSLEDLFESAKNDISAMMAKLRHGLTQLDKTTGDASERYRVKMISALAEYKSKALAAEELKQEVLFRHSQKLLSAIYPDDELQERCYNMFSYINRYGLEILNTIYDQISILTFDHQIITLWK